MNFREYEHYIDPDTADYIVEKAISDLKDHINERSKKVLEEVKTADDKLSDLQDEIKRAQHTLSCINGQIDAANNALIKEKRDMPKKYIQEFVSEATGGFAPGDEAWLLTGSWKECELCEGKKKVTVCIGGRDDTYETNCPKCKGAGTIYTPRTEIKKVKIGEVTLKLCFRESRVNYWSLDCLYDIYANRLEPKSLFRTEEEAIQAMENTPGATKAEA